MEDCLLVHALLGSPVSKMSGCILCKSDEGAVAWASWWMMSSVGTKVLPRSLFGK